jgi:uncharacterized protein YeaO (DUF488 family)
MHDNFSNELSFSESRESSDGFRMLITRFRPRYVKKENENWDAWYKELAPSRQLRYMITFT